MTRPVRTRRIHAWDLTVAQAARLQAKLAPEVIRRTTFPLRFGIASHIGVLLDRPAIG